MSEPLSAERLEELLRLHEAATPAPWLITDLLESEYGCGWYGIGHLREGLEPGTLSPCILFGHNTNLPRQANERLVVAARNALPDLVREIERLSGELAAMASDDVNLRGPITAEWLSSLRQEAASLRERIEAAKAALRLYSPGVTAAKKVEEALRILG